MADASTGGRLTPEAFKGEPAQWSDWSFAYESYSVKHKTDGPVKLRQAATTADPATLALSQLEADEDKEFALRVYSDLALLTRGAALRVSEEQSGETGCRPGTSWSASTRATA